MSLPAWCPHSICTLDPDSLAPLAELASLRELRLHYCTGLTIDALERLLSTSVQGCLLTIDVCGCQGLAPAEACTQMRQSVVAQRGSRDTPVLEIFEPPLVVAGAACVAVWHARCS
jgi:hypothetical protein